MTLRDVIASGAARLSGADAPRDAQLLLLHTLGIARTVLFTEPDRRLSATELTAYESAIVRRAAGEPIQYITGQQEFYGLLLKVTRAVLIPRPETELLVEAVLARLPRDHAIKIVDVGTGSGAIAIALAHNLSMAEVTAVDLSEAALAVARKNAATHGVAGRVRFLSSDLLEAVGSRELGKAGFDVVVSNPPYIPEGDRESLDRQVREYEPGMALFAGADGLDIYKRLVPQAWAALQPDGLLAMEIGYGQSAAIGALLERSDEWKAVEFLDDLGGIPRTVLARRAKAIPD